MITWPTCNHCGKELELIRPHVWDECDCPGAVKEFYEDQETREKQISAMHEDVKHQQLTNNKMSKVKYSLFVKHPSPDIQADSEAMKGREVVNFSLAVKDLAQLKAFGLVYPEGGIIPEYIYQFFVDAVNCGCLRVEILADETEFKLYVKPNNN